MRAVWPRTGEEEPLCYLVGSANSTTLVENDGEVRIVTGMLDVASG